MQIAAQQRDLDAGRRCAPGRLVGGHLRRQVQDSQPCHKTIWRCPAAGPNATTSTSHWGQAATPADPAFPARLVERCERQFNLRLDTFCPGGPVARCRNGRIAPQCGIAGIRLAACICRGPIQHPPLLVAPCSITRYPFRRLLGHRKTESAPWIPQWSGAGRQGYRPWGTVVPLRSAGRRAVIWALAGHLSSPGMAYWMVASSVYLYIAILGANARFCRGQGRAHGSVQPGDLAHAGDCGIRGYELVCPDSRTDRENACADARADP